MRIPDRFTPQKDTEQVALTMGFALFFGVFAVFVSLWNEGTIWRGLLWAGAWSAVGWFLGFLFGIPRFLATDTARTPGATAGDQAQQKLAAATEAARLRRLEAEQATTAHAAADQAAQEKATALGQAQQAATDAAAALAAQPGDTVLQQASDEAARAATAAQTASDAARQTADAAARTMQEAEAAAAQAGEAVEAAQRAVTAAAASPAAPRASLTVNTNLEQISDWLTKIIVGVSLVESKALLDQMERAASFMARSIAPAEKMLASTDSSAAAAAAAAAASAASSAVDGLAAAASAAAAFKVHAKDLAAFASLESVSYAIMLYFLVTGLLGSYLLTRLFLQRALANAALIDTP